MESTWETEHLPVLRAIVALSDEGNDYMEPGDIAKWTGFDAVTVDRALWALAGEDPPFFSYSDVTTFGGRAMGAITMPTGHARRTVGTWPTPEGLAGRIIAALEDTAVNAPTEEERSRAQKMLDGAKGVGKGVLTGVLIKVLTQGV